MLRLTLGRTAGLVLAAAVLLAGTPARADITFESLGPSPGSLAGPSLTVTTAVVSTYELAGVHADVAGVGTDLQGPAYWMAGTLDLTGVPRGPVTLTVVATDVLGGSATATVPLMRDDPPVITLSSPAHYLAGSPIRVVAACSDDGPAGCTSLQLEVKNPYTPFSFQASGTASLDVLVYAPEDTEYSVTLHAVDEDGSVSDLSTLVYVECNPALEPIATVRGTIADVDVGAARVVSVVETASPSDVWLRDVAAGTDTRLGAIAGIGHPGQYQLWLFSGGAVWASTFSGSTVSRYFEWRSGTATEILGGTFPMGLAGQAGDYVLAAPRPYAGTFVRRDLATDLESSVDLPSLYQGPMAALSADGVAYVLGIFSADPDTFHLFRAEPGGATDVGPVPAPMDWPLTDGTNVAYAGAEGVYLVEPSGAVSLLTAGGSFVLKGGWTAFTALSPGGVAQVWERAPDGTTSQITAFAADSTVEEIDAAGRVVFRVEGTYRYMAAPGAEPVPISASTSPLPEWVSPFWRPVNRGDDWYMLVGPTLARIVYPPPGGSRCSLPPDDAGVPDDAGAPDDGAPPQDVAASGGHGGGCAVAARAPTTGLTLVVALVLGLCASRRRHAS
jgi:hypothetical protein